MCVKSDGDVHTSYYDQMTAQVYNEEPMSL